MTAIVELSTSERRDDHARALCGYSLLCEKVFYLWAKLFRLCRGNLIPSFFNICFLYLVKTVLLPLALKRAEKILLIFVKSISDALHLSRFTNI